jgi:hypothetical protein
MYCPKCGKENQEDAKFCSSCNYELPGASSVKKDLTVKTSGLAIAAFVLGILSPFTCAITVIPAIILGIISLVQIERSGGRLTGRAFAIIRIVVPVSICLLIGILLPALAKARQIAYRMVCGTNLSQIGMAMLVYANDYEDELPRAGGKNTKWGQAVFWNAPDRFQAYSLQADGSGGFATISSSLYFLVKYYEVSPKSFICPGDSGAREFKPSDYPPAKGKELKDFWDFGPTPQKHCSYSYHIPYGLYALTSSSDPEMAIAADRNPWIASPDRDAKIWHFFKPDIFPWNGTAKQARYGNSVSHKEDGQQVLFMDSHVDFEKRPYCGIKDDNIYTFLPSGLGHPEIGKPPVPFDSQPGSKEDSLLVHDPQKPLKDETKLTLELKHS